MPKTFQETPYLFYFLKYAEALKSMTFFTSLFCLTLWTSCNSNPTPLSTHNIEQILQDSIKPATMTFDIILEEVTADFLMGKFDPSKNDKYILMKPPFSSNNMYARKEVMEAFKAMQAQAKIDGIQLTVVSCLRDFKLQKAIWEGKWNREKPVDGKILPPLSELKGKERALRILEWNAMPGTSRHHWGTDIDINSVNPEYFETEKGKKEYAWLVENAPKYGFCQTYSEVGSNRPTGYKEEKWHWSFMPLSQGFTQQYADKIKDKDITGFLGAESAVDIEVVKNYVLGINPACKAMLNLPTALLEEVAQEPILPIQNTDVEIIAPQ